MTDCSSSTITLLNSINLVVYILQGEVRPHTVR